MLITTNPYLFIDKWQNEAVIDEHKDSKELQGANHGCELLLLVEKLHFFKG